MDSTVFLIVAGAIVALLIQCFIAVEFLYIAQMKGHDENKYFWICFLFGIIGYLMVIALPDLYSHHANTQKYDDATDSTVSTPPTADPNYTGKTGGTAKAVVGEHSLRCARCEKWQSKANTTCDQCGATFTVFIPK